MARNQRISSQTQEALSWLLSRRLLALILGLQQSNVLGTDLPLSESTDVSHDGFWQACGLSYAEVIANDALQDPKFRQCCMMMLGLQRMPGTHHMATTMATVRRMVARTQAASQRTPKAWMGVSSHRKCTKVGPPSAAR